MWWVESATISCRY